VVGNVIDFVWFISGFGNNYWSNIVTSQLELIGERIVNLNRAFNIREGIGRKDDALPDRLTKIPSPAGPAKGHVVELEEMLSEYYKIRNWDQKTGFPNPEKLAELGLIDIVEEMNYSDLNSTS